MKEQSLRPMAVAVACAISLILCLWDMVWAFSGDGTEDVPYLETLLAAVNVIPLVFTVAAYLGRQWGRIGLIVITALGVLVLPFVVLVGEGEWAEVIYVESALYTAAAVVVLVLLMRPASAAWYRSLRAAEG